MCVRPRMFLAMLLAVWLAGCGQPQAQFALSERSEGLHRDARRGVEAALAENFGTPHDLVAWLRFPIDYGQYRGTIRSIDAGQGLPTFEVAFETPPGDDAGDLAGAGLLFTGGKYQGAGAPVAHYDAEIRSVTLRAELEAPPDPSDTVLIAGHNLQAGRRLYMTHCMHCHGVAGDGNGPTAKYLNPKPRDYRPGVFKFTSTGQQERATRADLARTIKLGIPGTYMPSFMMMDDGEIASIVEYVRWLAIRGEFEKRLVDELELDYSDRAFAEREEAGEERDAIEKELAAFLTDQLPDTIDSVAQELADAWSRAEEEDKVITPKAGREETIAALADEVTEWLTEHGGTLRYGRLSGVEKAEAGGLLFSVDADPPPQTEQVIVWLEGPATIKGQKYKVTSVTDGTNLALAPAVTGVPAIDPSNPPAVGDEFVFSADEIPSRLAYVVAHGADLRRLAQQAAADASRLRARLIADSTSRGRSLYLGDKTKCATCHGPQGRGDGDQTLAYQKIPGTNDEYPEPGLFNPAWNTKTQPRDLTKGIYRGGRRPIDLYRRIYSGIKGTPMPVFGELGTLNDDEIWDLVNYVMSIPYEGNSDSISQVAARRN